MKRKNIFYTICAASSLLLAGCSGSFLETEPTQYISDKQLSALAEQDPTILNGYLSGLYSKMYEVGSGGTTGHDDFGQKGYDIYMDMLAGDMVLGGDNYGWYEDVANLTSTINYASNRAYMPWRYYYSVISSANTVIETLGGNDATPDNAVGRHMMGQAKAMRAYAYFYLSNLYSKEAYGTGSERILPIYTATGSANNPKSTAQEVYDLIVNDLRQAVTLLDGFARGSSIHAINKNVAKGLLAYALATRGTTADLQEVVTLTQDILTDYTADGKVSVTAKNEVAAILDDNDKALNPESGFNNLNTKSWIWGVDLTLDAGLDLISWWGQVDYYTYSYAWAGDPKIIDESLYSEIPANDVRKGQFDADLWPTGKFFAPDRVVAGQRDIVTDYVYMRVDEIVLLKAEAHARLNQDVDARAALKILLAERFDDAADYAYVDGLSGQALKDEIYLQTRIELWGEGKVYLALKRNKKSVQRGPNHLFHANATFPYNSADITFLIPQAEVLNNPNLDK